MQGQKCKPINLVVRLKEWETFNPGQHISSGIFMTQPYAVRKASVAHMVASLTGTKTPPMEQSKDHEFLSHAVLKELNCYHLIFIECQHCTFVLGENRRDTLCAVGFVNYN